MKVMKGFVATVGLLPGLCAATPVSPPQMPMPPGIGIRLSTEGPIFVDSKGMTLYKASVAGYGPKCTDRRHAVLQPTLEGKVDFIVAAPDSDTRLTCVQKHPPLRAPEDAQPIGRWSVVLREDGSRQWAYDDEPVYTSIKDKTPGEINGSYAPNAADRFWTSAFAPLVGAPAGITARTTALGLALTSLAGKTLYYPDRDHAAAHSWQPLTAPALATADKLPGWSLVTRGDGSRQWAYRGRPLYTYVHDSVTTTMGFHSNEVFGGTYGQRVAGWHVALLKEAPAHPADVTIRSVLVGEFDFAHIKRAYADTKGMTLYTIHCVEQTADRAECDDVGDSPRYWLRFCGGEERCAKTWRPLAAPASAQPIDHIWSVITINPRHPWRALDDATKGLRVWAYRGRPVFTYAQDLRPEDHNGDGLFWSHGSGIYARVLPAYETNYRP